MFCKPWFVLLFIVAMIFFIIDLRLTAGTVSLIAEPLRRNSVRFSQTNRWFVVPSETKKEKGQDFWDP